jgi:hypothetical protein
LGALGEVNRFAEIVDLEDGRARFGSRLLELARLDLGEAMVVEVVPEQLANRSVNLEDGL